MCSFVYIGAFSESETIVQMARCSFEVHVADIIGTLINGGTLIMLHPGGILDFQYLATVLEQKQVTAITSVPSLFHSFFDFVEECQRQNAIGYLKTICCGGMYSFLILSFICGMVVCTL